VVGVVGGSAARRGMETAITVQNTAAKRFFWRGMMLWVLLGCYWAA